MVKRLEIFLVAAQYTVMFLIERPLVVELGRKKPGLSIAPKQRNLPGTKAN